MDYKRIEMYVGWTCNQKCTYCMEFPNMDRQWDTKVSKYDIIKSLLKYKKQGFNHVTLLGGEPFIQPVFLDALKLSKKFGYTILVTTNATTLHLNSQAKKFLPYIDELILSVEAIDKDLQQKISRTNVFVRWEEVFENIKKHWKGTYLKANIVITNDNLLSLFDLVKYVVSKGVKEISITYPDLDLYYYGKNHLKKYVAPRYKDAMLKVKEIYNFYNGKDINLKIVDFPFCIFPREDLEDYIKKTDEYDYGNRLKIGKGLFDDNYGSKFSLGKKRLEYKNIDYVINRDKVIPRKRRQIKKCNNCKYNNICWGPAVNYKTLYTYSEINPINDDK